MVGRKAILATLGVLLGISAAGCSSGASGAGQSDSTDAGSTPERTTESGSPTSRARTTTTVARPTTTAAPTTTTTTVAPTTTAAPTTTTVAPAPSTDGLSPLQPPLGAIGSADGAEAARVQQRLLDLGFWVAAVDGDYGLTTRQGVMAFQKYTGLAPTGEVDATTASWLGVMVHRVRARSTSGTLVEVDKDRQLLFVVDDGHTVLALNTSTGSGQYYRERNQNDPSRWETGRSITRSGRFEVYREREQGWWDGDLGSIYRPKYFSGGIAIHGSNSIPGYPASHGCVRVSVPAMDMIWASGLVPRGRAVWVYGADDEAETPPPSVPVTNPPATNPPATDPPATNPPATDPPPTSPPTPSTTTPTTAPPTSPPPTSAPTTTPPATTPPPTTSP